MEKLDSDLTWARPYVDRARDVSPITLIDGLASTAIDGRTG
jgi:hypothetical protein